MPLCVPLAHAVAEPLKDAVTVALGESVEDTVPQAEGVALPLPQPLGEPVAQGDADAE